MLVMVTHGCGLKLWNHIANLKLIVAAVILILDDWRCRRKDFQSIGSRLCLMPRFRSSLLWFLGALCSFIFACVGVGLNTQLRTCGCIAQFWWPIFLGRFAQTIQTCKGLLFFKRTFFFAEGRPDGVRKYGKMRPKYGHIRPVWIRPNQKDIFLKTHLFFTVRPSISQNCVSSWHHKVRASGCAQSPCVFFRSVAMCTCLPPQLVLYLDTNRGSKVVLPRSFSHTSHTPEMMCEGAWSNIRQDKHKTFTWFGLVMLNIQPAHAWKTNMESSSGIWSGLLHIKVK